MTNEPQRTEGDELVDQARETELEDVESFLVALDRLDRWLGLPDDEQAARGASVDEDAEEEKDEAL